MLDPAYVRSLSMNPGVASVATEWFGLEESEKLQLNVEVNGSLNVTVQGLG